MRSNKKVETILLSQGTITNAPRGTKTAVFLPLPPSTNNLFVNAGKKGRVKSKEYKSWLNAVVPDLRQQMRPAVMPVEVVVTVFGGGDFNRDRDTDNFGKPCGDALVAAGVLPGDSIRDGVYRTVQQYRQASGESSQVMVEVRSLAEF